MIQEESKRSSLLDRIIEASYENARGRNVIELSKLAKILREYHYTETLDGHSFLGQTCIDKDSSPYDTLLRILNSNDITLLRVLRKSGPMRWGKLRSISGLDLADFKDSLYRIKARELAVFTRERGESKYDTAGLGLNVLEGWESKQNDKPARHTV